MTAVALAAWMGVLTGCRAGSDVTTESTAAATTEAVTQAEETTAQTTADAATEESTSKSDGPQSGARNGGGSSMDKSSDTELQQMIADVIPKFKLCSYTDEETGTTLKYYLFTPEQEAESYPLVQFIPDASVVGKDDETVLNQGWGGLIWATDAEQEKHPCYVLVPVFSEVVVDDNFNTSDQIETEKKLIDELCATEPIDTNRLYTTGQSMGGMTSFHMNITYPDLFAASIFVGSQWNTEILQPLEDKTFFYIAAAGDSKASAGQTDLKALFDADGAAYSEGEWSAQEDESVQSENATSCLSGKAWCQPL